jgi:hypothetical protein
LWLQFVVMNSPDVCFFTNFRSSTHLWYVWKLQLATESLVTISLPVASHAANYRRWDRRETADSEQFGIVCVRNLNYRIIQETPAAFSPTVR